MSGPGQPPPGWQQDPVTGQWFPPPGWQQDPATGQWGPPPAPQGPPTAQWGPQHGPGPGQTGQWGPPQATAPAPEQKPRKLIPLVTAAVLAVALTVGGLYFFGAFSTEVRVEPVAYTDPDQFTASVGDGQQVPPPATAPVPVGNAPGLYGGTGTNSCDVNQLVTFLQATPDKAAAWAGVLGISTTDIPTYVAGLTPVLLRVDTAVTNHGFKNGKATTVNSVLQAGSAVLVDANGVPRVRCKCGNPLLEGKKFSRSSYTGTQWSGFTPTGVILVQASAQPITNFQLVNPTTGATYQQAAGSAVPSATSAPRPSAASPQATPGLPAINGRRYLGKGQVSSCVGFSECNSFAGGREFDAKFTCSNATTCTNTVNGSVYTLNGNTWSRPATQATGTSELTCGPTQSKVPTTSRVTFTVDSSGRIRVDASLEGSNCPDNLKVVVSYNLSPS